jgi:hypothetical protein
MSPAEFFGLIVIIIYGYRLVVLDRIRRQEGEARCDDWQDEQSMYNDLRNGG